MTDRQPASTAAELKEQHRAMRDEQPESLSIRIHRAISWLGRAGEESDDPDARFLFLGWIGDRPYHVVASYDSEAHHSYVITAYEPSTVYFESDFKTRRKP